MERLTHWRVNGIKSGHWSPAKKEELIQRLAAYEDTGLTPEEIEALKKGDQNNVIRIDLGKQVELTVPVTAKRVRDIKDCMYQASLPGDGKDCNSCSLDIDVFGQSLCELPIVIEQLMEWPE